MKIVYQPGDEVYCVNNGRIFTVSAYNETTGMYNLKSDNLDANDISEEYLAPVMLNKADVTRWLGAQFGLDSMLFWPKSSNTPKTKDDLLKEGYALEDILCNDCELVKVPVTLWKKCEAAGVVADKEFFIDSGAEGDYPRGPFVFRNGILSSALKPEIEYNIDSLANLIEAGEKVVDAEEALGKMGFIRSERKKNSMAVIQDNTQPKKNDTVSDTNNASYPRKVSEAHSQAAEIFSDYNTGEYSIRALAKKYNTSISTTYRIIKKEQSNLRSRMQSAIDAA
jgi:hypothetical protein